MKKLLRSLALTLLLTGSMASTSYADGAEPPPTCPPEDRTCRPPVVGIR